MAGRKPKKCPFCGGKAIIPILYGMPAPAAVEKEAQGKLKLGGCCVPFDGPDWYCKTCERELFGEVPELSL